jgi:hypothetical protein
MRNIGGAAFVVGLAVLTTACGKKGALIYPDMLIPAAPTAVVAQQSGAAVKLQFNLSDKDRAGRSLRGLAGVKISRKAAETAQKEYCRACMTDYRLFRTIYLDRLPLDTQRFGSRLIVRDGDVNPGTTYSYSLVPFTDDGVDGAASAIADVHVVPSLPAPVVKIESYPTEVKLEILSQPRMSCSLSGYNLYRSTVTGARLYLPLNSEPLKGSVYVDTSLERGVKYRYSVRELVVLPEGVVESAESQEVEGMLKDDE